MSIPKKPIFFDSLEEMEDHNLFRSLEWSAGERLQVMYTISEQVFGPPVRPAGPGLELYVARPGESVNEFYRRVNKDRPD